MSARKLLAGSLAGALLLAACASADTTSDAGAGSSTESSSSSLTSSSSETTDGSPSAAVDTTTFRPWEDDGPFDLSGGATSGTEEDELIAGSESELPGGVRLAAVPWPTDWSRTTIDYSELAAGLGGTDPRDRIPPIDRPVFETPSAAAQWIGPNEPGAVVRLDGEARFYPLSIMTAHEIVNDRFGDVPVAVTFCPLCNTALAFDRRIDGQVLRLGVSGLLRSSDLVMWDDLTTSLWQQITGEGIAGTYAGSRLEVISTQIVSFSQFSETFPDGWSLSQDTGFGRQYGVNPYVGYSSSDRPIQGFFPDEPDPRFPALERVVGVLAPDADKSYPFSILSAEVVVNDTIGSTPVVAWWASGTADALDERRIADSADIGSAAAYGRTLEDGTELTFDPGESPGTFVDGQTGSTWNLFGQATGGQLEGTQLPPVPHRNEFWFAWAAFFPEGEVYGE